VLDLERKWSDNAVQWVQMVTLFAVVGVLVVAAMAEAHSIQKVFQDDLESAGL